MRIGYVLLEFPILTETFIRREILALQQAGNSLFVYAHRRHDDPLVSGLADSGITIREVPFDAQRQPAGLIQAIQQDAVGHIHSSLTIPAHMAAYHAARALQIPFSITVYSGHDAFTARDPNLYRSLSNDPLCSAVIVEDPFMRDWAIRRLGANPDKVVMIPNSFDLNDYHLSEPRHPDVHTKILAIARFVEKKGLIYLVQAFNQLYKLRQDIELWLVGDGPEEPRLRREASNNPAIQFLGAVMEARCRQLYQAADIFCLPCIQTSKGDADGVPTTVLEAMAFELPVISSNLLSMPHYIRNEDEGLLVAPRDVAALALALGRLCADPVLRQKMGQAGRSRVAELCDLNRNLERLQDAMGAQRRWHESIEALIKQREGYSAEILQQYESRRASAAAFFQPRPGLLLDLGCGEGDFRRQLPSGVGYVGCDPIYPTRDRPDFPFSVAFGENLPFTDGSFDSVLIYAVLTCIQDVDSALAETARVLKPGGYVYLHDTVNDPNPNHLNHFTMESLTNVFATRFQIQASRLEGSRYLFQVYRKPRARASRKTRNKLMVSIAITTYNRSKFIRKAIESALNQTYHPVEVVVVDDGSKDGTHQVLESYGTAIRVAYHETNLGIAAAKNHALRMTSPKAKYVCILDSDDFFLPEFVERCVDFLEYNSEIGLVYTSDTLVDVNGHELARKQRVSPWNLDTWLRTCNLRGDSWLARRDLVMQTSLHNEGLKCDVDYDLFYQLLEITSFAHLPEYLVAFRQSPDQVSKKQFELAKYHAANLVRYGYSLEYAYHRARRNPEWIPAIKEGILIGEKFKTRLRQGTEQNEHPLLDHP